MSHLRERFEKGYSSENKDALLLRLGIGTVCITSVNTTYSRAELQRAFHRERQDKKDAERKAEISSQAAMHTQMSHCHPHPLAPTNSLKFHGAPRKCWCSNCDEREREIIASNGIHNYYGYSRYLNHGNRGTCVWTCDVCDFDLCKECFEYYNVSAEEQSKRKEESVRKAKEEKEKREKQEREEREKFRKQKEEEEKKSKEIFDAALSNSRRALARSSSSTADARSVPANNASVYLCYVCQGSKRERPDTRVFAVCDSVEAARLACRDVAWRNRDPYFMDYHQDGFGSHDDSEFWKAAFVSGKYDNREINYDTSDIFRVWFEAARVQSASNFPHHEFVDDDEEEEGFF